MDEIIHLDKFMATPYRQDIELQQISHEAGFNTLRLRIREIKRFTIFEVDSASARQWGNAMLEWADSQDKGVTK